MTPTERSAEYLKAIEAELKSVFDRLVGTEPQLREAMEYSLLAGGKRIRPQLLLEFCRVGGGDWKQALPFACGLEMIHTYSLIHDDLPCMDDDDLRRGRPTNHKVFGECMAVLAGDGLLTAAFELMLQPMPIPADRQLRAARIIAEAAGGRGMAGGQVLDMASGDLTYEAVSEIQKKKTGALIRAAAEAGLVLAGDDLRVRNGVTYAERLGLAFQVRDDLLDLEGDPALLGKNVGMDQGLGKRTFPAFLGIEESRALLHRLTEEAIAELSVFEDREYLAELARIMERRMF